MNLGHGGGAEGTGLVGRCVFVEGGGGVDWIKQWRRMRKNILDTDNLLWGITDHIHTSEGDHVKIFLCLPKLLCG